MAKWTVSRVLFDDGGFSAIYGVFSKPGEEDFATIGTRWPYFPPANYYSAVPDFLHKSMVTGLREELTRLTQLSPPPPQAKEQLAEVNELMKERGWD